MTSKRKRTIVLVDEVFSIALSYVLGLWVISLISVGLGYLSVVISSKLA